MFPRAVRVATIGGVDVRVDPSWLVIALLVVWSFTRRFEAAYGHSLGVAVALGVFGAVLFFGSLLAHELGHALEAKHRDIAVGGITLFLFGGVTETHVEAARPRDEFVMAAVGPWISLVAAALFGLLSTAASYFPDESARALANVFGVLGWINVGLAIFNLIPGAPLDGGRVLRSALWAALKDRDRAARYAARAGQVVAAGLLAFGLWSLFRPEGGLVNGLWFGFIGWFMFQATRAEIAQAELRSVIRGRTVGDLLARDPVLLPADRPLSLLTDLLAGETGHQAFAVVSADEDEILGALRLEDVRAVEPFDRSFRTAGDIMRPIRQVPAIALEAPLDELIEHHREHEVVRVMHGPELWALLTPGDIGSALMRLHLLETTGGARRRAAIAASGRRSGTGP